MSASLVGSEMCIRDRGRTADRGRFGGLRAARRSRARAALAQAAGAWAVSYTHLTLPTICSV
eukprot:323262-Alexandrium_andersonii.AAC.1